MYQNSLINKINLKRKYILIKMIKMMNLLKIKYLQVSIFYKTYIRSNNLPLDSKIIEDDEECKTKLEQRLWDVILE